MSDVQRHMRTEDWEAAVGAQVRELRRRSHQRQRDLARTANVSVAALQRLEAGKGSTLATLVAVLRALDRETWLRQLAPPVSVSPMEALRERRAEERTLKRMSARRTAKATAANSASTKRTKSTAGMEDGQ